MTTNSLVRPRHGGNLDWAASVAGCSPTDILDFSASINPLGPPKSAITAIKTNLSQLNLYPEPEYRELRHALAQFHASVDPDWILPGNGAAELLTWVGRELAQLEAVNLLTPAFADYRRSLRAFGAKVVDCSIGTFESDQLQDRPQAIDSLIEKLHYHPLFDMGILLNNPHNPTGWLFLREALKPYLNDFTLVVVDEAFMDFLPPDQQHSLIELVTEFENLVILRSLTKFYSLPGLRLGYVITHPDRIRRWQKWRDPWPVNSLASAAGAAVLQDKAFQQKTWNWLTTARPKLLEGLSQLPGLYPYTATANFVLVHSQKSVSKLQIKLLKHHQILIRDCLSFPELGDHYFRVAIRTEVENQKLLDALAAVLSQTREKENSQKST
ncbi:MAG: threonine-phosphate decarboxylase CobD [Microcoleaceae cyanobacterium]